MIHRPNTPPGRPRLSANPRSVRAITDPDAVTHAFRSGRSAAVTEQNTDRPEPLLVRPNVAARMIGYGRTKFFELLKDGEIKAIRKGRATLIEVAELRRWIEKQKASAS